MMLNKKMLTVCMVMATISQTPAQAAGTLAGQVGVQMVIGAGCTVLNGTVNGVGNQWGTLDFGTSADLSNVVDAQLIGASGNIQIQCNEDLSPTLTVNQGQNGTATQRYMKINATDESNIAYSLYQDSARSTPIVPNTPLSITPLATGAAVDFPLYGRVTPTGQATTTPTAGTYTDTLLVTLAW